MSRIGKTLKLDAPFTLSTPPQHLTPLFFRFVQVNMAQMQRIHDRELQEHALEEEDDLPRYEYQGSIKGMTSRFTFFLAHSHSLRFAFFWHTVLTTLEIRVFLAHSAHTLSFFFFFFFF